MIEHMPGRATHGPVWIPAFAAARAEGVNLAAQRGSQAVEQGLMRLGQGFDGRGV
jgi:hypothetical protein